MIREIEDAVVGRPTDLLAKVGNTAVAIMMMPPIEFLRGYFGIEYGQENSGSSLETPGDKPGLGFIPNVPEFYEKTGKPFYGAGKMSRRFLGGFP